MCYCIAVSCMVDDRWQSTMFAARQKIPSAEEVSKRKARMREAVFGASSHSAQDITDTKIFSKASERYSEGDVARLVNSRRKRSEAVILPSETSCET